MAADHIYEVRLRWANVYERPSTFSAARCRLGRGQRFVGQMLGKAWAQRATGGYVRRASVRDLGERSVNQELMTAAVERFSAAYGGDVAATGDLLEALAATAQQLVTASAVALLERQDEQAKRQDELERKQELLQRHTEAIDVRLGILERRLNGVRQHAADVQQRADTRIDVLLREQLEPKQRDELIGVLYQVSARTTDLEQRMTTLEQRQVGGAHAD